MKFLLDPTKLILGLKALIPYLSQIDMILKKDFLTQTRPKVKICWPKKKQQTCNYNPTWAKSKNLKPNNTRKEKLTL